MLSTVMFAEESITVDSEGVIISSGPTLGAGSLVNQESVVAGQAPSSTMSDEV